MENEEMIATGNETVEGNQEPEQKLFTEEQVQERINAAVGGRVGRLEAKHKRDLEKYESLVRTLEAGTGLSGPEALEDKYRGFFTEKGISVPDRPVFNDRDVEVLGNSDAQEIIGYGTEYIDQRVDELARKGNEMTAREKAEFKVLASNRQVRERSREFANLGITEDVYGSKDFSDLASKMSPSVPAADVVELYNKLHPPKEIRTMGSMRTNPSADNGVKDFYTYEEASKFTKADFDKNPALFKAVEASMTKW